MIQYENKTLSVLGRRGGSSTLLMIFLPVGLGLRGLGLCFRRTSAAAHTVLKRQVHGADGSSGDAADLRAQGALTLLAGWLPVRAATGVVSFL